MKRTRTLWMALVLCVAVSARAEKQPNYHFMSVNANLPYSTLLRSTLEPTRLDVQPWLGSAPAVGIGYHLYKNHFTLDISGELEYGVYANRSGSNIAIGATTVPAGMVEMIQNLNVNIPIMFGAEFGRFMFRVGAGPSFCVYGTGARSEAGAKQYKVSRMPQLRCRAEIGAQVGKLVPMGEKQLARYYVAAYADYGVLNERPLQRKGSYADGVPYHICDESTADKVHNLTVGVKFTCLLDFSK